ncbi:MAG: hypothetical protein GQ574_07135 [Crocinitomix sp.]|nr:hypothetical protein [Crocinitomix sp.]
MSTTHSARIFFLLAREANKAVVFRRGPTKWTQMIVWDLESDELEYGQWSKVKLRPRCCDLSPSGKYLIYLDDQFEENDSTTAISKPPYWAALYKWKHHAPLFGSGGGVFKSETELELNGIRGSAIATEGLLPENLKVGVFLGDVLKNYNLWKGHINPLLEHRLKREGWSEIENQSFVEKETSGNVTRKPSERWNETNPESKAPMEPKLFEKKITQSSFLWMISYYHSDMGKTLTTFYLKKRVLKTKLDGFFWADVDHNGRIIATKNGQLYASKRLKDGAVQLLNLELLHDLNSQKPTKVEAPDEMKKW